MIIDTMVFVYALLKVDNKYEESLEVLEKANKVVVPDSFRAEFTNVVWQWVKHGNIPQEYAYNTLQDAEGFIDQVVSSEKIWLKALQLAIASDHPAYDTLFVAAAMSQNEKVVTYDKKMQDKFPNWVLSPQGFLN